MGSVFLGAHFAAAGDFYLVGLRRETAAFYEFCEGFFEGFVEEWDAAAAGFADEVVAVLDVGWG